MTKSDLKEYEIEFTLTGRTTIEATSEEDALEHLKRYFLRERLPIILREYGLSSSMALDVVHSAETEWSRHQRRKLGIVDDEEDE